MYKLTNTKTGHSFKMSYQETADFFYKKNAYGDYINFLEDYDLEEQSTLTDLVFYSGMFGSITHSVFSIYLFLKWN